MNYKHGDARNNHIARLNRIWRLMKNRCRNPNSEAYKNYGGRNVTVCDEWLDYAAFKEWALSHGYRDDLTIDRINNDLGYCPENCRWITREQQQSNKRTNKYYTIGNETHYLNEWARIYGVSASAMINRMKRGWSAYDAITTPLKRHFKK